jgi:hypothetical protein
VGTDFRVISIFQSLALINNGTNHVVLFFCFELKLHQEKRENVPKASLECWN